MKQLRRTFGVPAMIMVIGCFFLCVFAPWQQVHPSEASLVHSLGRAALWTHAYDQVPGARLDSFEFLLEALVMLAGCTLFGLFRDDVIKTRSA